MKVSAKGQITIPKHLREQVGLNPGTEILLVPAEEGLHLRKKEQGRHPIWDYLGFLGQGEDTDALIEELRGR
jgi:AbrB family looped-hinge helix DNA binding protein